jgi:hypothetical protein
MTLGYYNRLQAGLLEVVHMMMVGVAEAAAGPMGGPKLNEEAAPVCSRNT